MDDLLVEFPGGLHGGWLGVVPAVEGVCDTCVCYIGVGSVWRKCDAWATVSSECLILGVGRTVGMNKAISYRSHCTGFVVESVDLLTDTWIRAEILQIAVERVREVDILVSWMDGDVI